MDKMRRWLGARGYRLEVAADAVDCVDFASKTVSINAAHTYHVKLSSLIHECGHVRIFLSRMRSPGRRVCGSTLAEQCLLVGRREPRARASRIATLQEEMEAWESGEILARSLAVRYHRGVLEKDRLRALMSYVRHTACRMRMAEEEKNARMRLEIALDGFVKFQVARSKKRSRAVKKIKKGEKRRAA